MHPTHPHQIRLAINEGANIIGYLHLSLMDNYEWHDTYKPEAKFGLFYIDRNNSNLTRKITNGAEAYKFITQESIQQNTEGMVEI